MRCVLALFLYIFCSLIPLTLFFCFYYEYCLMNLKLSTCVHLDGPRGAGGGREPLPSRVEGSMGRRYHACSTGRREHAARNRGDRYQRQAPKPRSVRHPKQAQMQMEPGSVPCGGRRVEVRMPMRRAGSRGVLAMRRRYAKADTATPCGYRYAVRVTGQASSCAHILSHPLSAACRPVCRAAGLSEQIEVAQPYPGNHRWADPQA